MEWREECTYLEKEKYDSHKKFNDRNIGIRNECMYLEKEKM